MLNNVLLVVNCAVQLGSDTILVWPIEVASGRKDQLHDWQEPFPCYTIHGEPHFDPMEMGMVIQNLPVIAHLCPSYRLSDKSRRANHKEQS
jgi:hypothetical protein